MGGPGNADLIRLLYKARQGDERALEAMLARLRPEVVRYFRGRMQSHPATNALADELAQIVLMRTAQSLGDIRAKDSRTLRSWVFTVSERVAVDWYRRRKREMDRRVWDVEAQGEVWASGRALLPADSEEDACQDDRVAQAVGRLLMQAQQVLSEGTRTVIRRRLLYGDNWREAGEEIGTTAGGAKRRWQRAQVRLRYELLRRASELPPDLREAVLRRVGMGPGGDCE